MDANACRITVLAPAAPPPDVLQACLDLELTGLTRTLTGPLQMIFLACGLGIVLRQYMRLGYSFRLKAFDWLLVAVLVGSAVGGIAQNIITRSSGLLTDPLLCCLLLQAIVLRRSIAQMGGGCLSRG